LLALTVLTVLLRATLLPAQGPIVVGDTPTYMTAALDLLTGDFTKGEGRRTPGYPVFLLLTGENFADVVFAQALVGVGSALLLFAIAFRLLPSAPVAFACALAYGLSIQQVLLEGTVATEALTTFTLAACLLTLLVGIQRAGRHRSPTRWWVATGILAAVTIMVRAQFLFLLPLLPLVVLAALWRSRLGWGPRLLQAAAVVLPGVLAVLGWSAVVQAKTGHFTLSTQSGFSVINHSIEFIELAPERYAVVRDILLQYRERMVEAKGHAGNTGWWAWPEIQRATGWTLPEASREFKTMSSEMFLAHPLLYAQSVFYAWLQFWTVPIHWQPERITDARIVSAVEVVWPIQHKMLRGANLLFVLLCAAVLLSPRVRHAVRWDLGLTAISLVILGSSLMQALADRGAGSRYAVTVQALIVLVLVVAAARWWRARAAAAPPRRDDAPVADAGIPG
jgi:4-amino-4-deoxy-L-arabinose transferase-like glycosyltransferase